MNDTLYQFEVGEYSDRRQGEPVLGPADADIPALVREWGDAVALEAYDGDPIVWRYDEGAMLRALGPVAGLPAPDWSDEAAFFTLWLVARKGWELREARSVAIGDMIDANDPGP